MKIRKAVIPAAGLGTRFIPATKAPPKEMLTIINKPTIIGRMQEPTQLANLHYIRQTEPFGLGHAIWCARAFVQNELFAVR